MDVGIGWWIHERVLGGRWKLNLVRDDRSSTLIGTRRTPVPDDARPLLSPLYAPGRLIIHARTFFNC